jgi:hypothetical protein
VKKTGRNGNGRKENMVYIDPTKYQKELTADDFKQHLFCGQGWSTEYPRKSCPICGSDMDLYVPTGWKCKKCDSIN